MRGSSQGGSLPLKAEVLDPKLTDDQRDQIQLVFERVRSILPEDQAHQKGGYFRYYRRNPDMGPEANSIDDHYYLVEEFQLGEVSPDKLITYMELSQEKAYRLAARTTEQASWSSRNPDKEQWGGAVRTRYGKHILSFSGLPERFDEALALVIGILIRGYGFYETANFIAIRTENPEYFRLIAVCLDLLPKDGR